MRRDRTIPLLLGALTVQLFALQHLTLSKLAIAPAGAGMVSFATFAHQLLEQVSFTAVDLGLGFSILITCELLLATEVLFCGLTRFLDRALATERGALILLAATGLVLVRFYFAPGQPTWAGDSGGHITYAFIAAHSFATGELPIWTNAFSAGSPYVQFYGFLFFYLVGLCNLLVDDPFNAIKLVTGLSHWASGLGMYLLVRTATGSRRAGLLAGIAYVASFWHTQQVVIMGRLPLSVFYALLPFPFYALDKLYQRGLSATPVVGGAISLSALAFVHAGYAFWGVFFFCAYAGIRLRTADKTRLFGTLGILGGGLVFGAYQTLPMWLERDLVGLAEGIHLGGGAIPSWRQVLVWSNAYFRLSPLPPEQHNWHGGYLGLSLVVVTVSGLAALSVTTAIRHRIAVGSTNPAWAAFAGLGLAGLTVFAHDGPILSDLAVVQAFNAGRFLLFVVFFLALCCGIAAHWLHRAGTGRIYTFLLLFVLVDLGSTTFRNLYIPRWAQPIDYPAEIVRDLNADAPDRAWPELPNHRIFATTQYHHFYLLVPWLFGQTGMPQVQSAYFAAPKAWFALIHPWTEWAQRLWEEVDTPSRDQTEFLLAGAKLFNVRDILAARAANAVARIKTRTDSPVLAASQIAPYPEEEVARYATSAEAAQILSTDPDLLGRVAPIYWLIQSMAIDLKSNICERIYVRDHEPHTRTQHRPQVDLLEHRVYNQRVLLHLQTTEPCYVRLAYAYYPHLRLTVNSREVTPLETAGHFIALPLDAGDHRIEITASLSPLRRGLLLLDLVLFCVGVAWIYTERRKNV